MPCRVMIADNHEIVRMGVRAILEHEEELSVCCEAVDGLDAIKKAAQHQPHISIMEIAMPVTNGIIAARMMLRENPGHKVIIFTGSESREYIRAAIEAGIRGLVFKTAPTASLLAAVAAVRHDQPFFPPEIPTLVGTEVVQLIPGQKRNVHELVLTPREYQTLQLIAEGQSSKEIAVCLGISAKTVETHRSRMMRKLGVHSSAAATFYAISHHIIDLGPLTAIPRHSSGLPGIVEEAIAADTESISLRSWGRRLLSFVKKTSSLQQVQ